MNRNGTDRPEAQNAWRAFESSGKVADYLSYAQCAHPKQGESEQPEDGRNADKNQGNRPQAAEYR